ncbi:alpha/beta fold hydrolase [Nocardiopsis nanhaiensis]
MTETAVPIALLHGVGLDTSMWGPLVDELARRTDRPVVAIDLPGHGSEPVLPEAVTLDGLADDVAERLPARMHLVGFSVGALVAERLASRRPDRIETLTCVSSVYERTPVESQSVRDRLDTATRDFHASVEASIRRWYPEGTPVSEEQVEATRSVLLSNDTASYLRVYEVFATADQQVAEDLAGLAMPVLAVTGSEDPGSTPAMTESIARTVPDGRGVVVDGARHMLPTECPQELADTILTFLDETSGDPYG